VAVTARRLRDCPFCLTDGAMVVVGTEPFDSRHVSAVQCPCCGAKGPEVSGVTRDEARQRALDAWGYK
jgi:hypothetical protein